MPQSPSSNDRLDSWKEIAAYLNRTERTVIRWEKRGLPVRRVPGGKKQAVFAYKHELDGWLELGVVSEGPLTQPPGQHQAAGEWELDLAVSDSADASSNQPANLPGTKSILRDQSTENLEALPAIKTDKTSEQRVPAAQVTRKTKWKQIGFLACAVGFVAVIIGLLIFNKPVIGRIAHVQKVTDDGRAKTNLRADGTTLYFNEFEAKREILMAAPAEGGPIHAMNTPFANVDLQDISNDSQKLLVTSFEGMEKGARPLWVIPAQGGTPHRVGDMLCDFARWSPDNRRIACINGTSILMFASDGSAVRTVGSFSLLPRQLLWSPGGDRLRFVLLDDAAQTKTPWEIVINKDESTTLASIPGLPLERGCCEAWIWTRDSKDFLYTNPDMNGHPALFVRQHGWWVREAELPVISNIGDIVPGKGNEQVYALIGSDYRGQLLKFDSKSNMFQAFLPGLSADCLSFSPDGQWMTYRSRPDMSLWRSRIDGRDAVQLAKPPMQTEYSAWSPDGRQIAFMLRKPGRPWRIFLTDSQGTAMKEAAQGSDDQGAPTWSADGAKLVYGNTSCEKTQPCWIRRIDLATGKEEKLPGSYGFRTARWSPDGKYIMALQNETHELMLFDVRTERWTTLADSITGDGPNWSSDSQYIYVDTLQANRPVVERIRIRDGKRSTLVDLAPLQKSPGQLDYWIGLAPDNSPILLHQFTAVEVYSLEWTRL